MSLKSHKVITFLSDIQYAELVAYTRLKRTNGSAAIRDGLKEIGAIGVNLQALDLGTIKSRTAANILFDEDVALELNNISHQNSDTWSETVNMQLRLAFAAYHRRRGS